MTESVINVTEAEEEKESWPGTRINFFLNKKYKQSLTHKFMKRNETWGVKVEGKQGKSSDFTTQI